MGVLGAAGHDAESLEIELNWIDEHIDGKPYGVDLTAPTSMATTDDTTPEQTLDMVPDEHRDFARSIRGVRCRARIACECCAASATPAWRACSARRSRRGASSVCGCRARCPTRRRSRASALCWRSAARARRSRRAWPVSGAGRRRDDRGREHHCRAVVDEEPPGRAGPGDAPDEEGRAVAFRDEGSYRRGRGIGPGRTVWRRRMPCRTEARSGREATPAAGGQRAENRAAQVDWRVAARAGRRRLLDKAGAAEEAERRPARAKAEHPFRRVKRRFGCARYRGLAGNTQRLALPARVVQPARRGLTRGQSVQSRRGAAAGEPPGQEKATLDMPARPSRLKRPGQPPRRTPKPGLFRLSLGY